MIFITLAAVVAAGYFYFFSGLAFCLTEDNCVQPRCIDCRNMCIKHQCTFVQCADHGTFTFEKGCVCQAGYAGRYCEIKITE